MIYQRSGNYLQGLINLTNQYLVGKKDLVGIQIGSFGGQSAEIFIKSGAFKKLYCIDPWEQGFDPNDVGTSNELPEAEQKFDLRFKYCPIVEKVKLYSSDAVSLFKDESIDFIYIDGNHQYEYVKCDIENYFKKLKKGGIISGHDYDETGSIFHIRGIKRAVDQFFNEKPLKVYEDTSWVFIKK